MPPPEEEGACYFCDRDVLTFNHFSMYYVRRTNSPVSQGSEAEYFIKEVGRRMVTTQTTGNSSPLGATVGHGGANFSLFSRDATGVELLLFDRPDDKKRARLNCITHLLSLIPYEKLPREKIKIPKRSNKGKYDDEATLKGKRFIPEKY